MKNLTFEERQAIETFLVDGKSHREIANFLKRDRRSIDREVLRNSTTIGYSADLAQVYAMLRIGKPRQNIKSNDEKIIKFVTDNISQFSPDVISGRAKLEKNQINISHETIYKIIYTHDELLTQFLATKRKKRKHRKAASYVDGRGSLADQRWIDERPYSINNRSRFGHLEIDTIVGKNHKGAIVTAVDKKSCFAFGGLCKDRKAHTVTSNLVYQLKKSKRPIRSITADNGKEFAQHKKLEESTQAKVYFAHPGCPHQRGQNENFNRILRRYFPKKTDFSKLDARTVQAAIRRINNTPRKLLNYLTPAEVFNNLKPGAILF